MNIIYYMLIDLNAFIRLIKANNIKVKLTLVNSELEIVLVQQMGRLFIPAIYIELSLKKQQHCRGSKASFTQQAKVPQIGFFLLICFITIGGSRSVNTNTGQQAVEGQCVEMCFMPRSHHSWLCLRIHTHTPLYRSSSLCNTKSHNGFLFRLIHVIKCTGVHCTSMLTSVASMFTSVQQGATF